MLVVLYLTSIVSAISNHEPQVHEELNEEMPQIVRIARHSHNTQKAYQPPVFNFRTATQQDRMKNRYHRQQQADLRHLKIVPVKPDEFFDLNQHFSQNRDIPLKDTGNDWKPFQPRYLASPKEKSQLEVVGKNRFADLKQVEDTAQGNIFENDLEAAGSENKEEKTKLDREDKYIYIQPNILKNNFGLDQKTTQEILQKSAPGASSTNAEEFKISELQELLGKNPEYQLQGLQMLLQNTKPGLQNIEEETAGVKMNPNSLPNFSLNHPPLDDLQKQIDAVNKAHADAALAAAHKQAEAHVLAQHKAIALAQQQAEAEALAKIAAHNQAGSAAHNQAASTLNPIGHMKIHDVVASITPAPLIAPSPQPQQAVVIHQIEQNSLESQPEKVEDVDQSAQIENAETPQTLALIGRPYEEVLLHHQHKDSRGYASSFTDLHNIKSKINIPTGRIYQPTPFTKIHSGPSPHQPLPEIYAPSEVHGYAAVAPHTPNLEPQSTQIQVDISKLVPVPTRSTFVPLPALQQHRQESYQQIKVDSSHSIQNQLYSEQNHEQYDDLHQYAAKYAFGYRILDEKSGNDFGHQEEREGKLTKGHYFVLLPDGRRQKVEYYVDKSGYHATVSYESVGQHPYVPQYPQDHGEHSAELRSLVHK